MRGVRRKFQTKGMWSDNFMEGLEQVIRMILAAGSGLHTPPPPPRGCGFKSHSRQLQSLVCFYMYCLALFSSLMYTVYTCTFEKGVCCMVACVHQSQGPFFICHSQNMAVSLFCSNQPNNHIYTCTCNRMRVRSIFICRS